MGGTGPDHVFEGLFSDGVTTRQGTGARDVPADALARRGSNYAEALKTLPWFCFLAAASGDGSRSVPGSVRISVGDSQRSSTRQLQPAVVTSI
jgi:hypothetical protein